MTALHDNEQARRFEQDFTAADGRLARVFCDYAVASGHRILLHVEAEPALRGSGAAGRFMEALAVHARAHGLTLRPACSYAVAWFRRRPEYSDILD